MPEAAVSGDHHEYRDHFYASSDGLTLYARDYAGPGDSTRLPVLCMHGLTRNSRDFAWIASHLAATRRVISVDQRGRGRSDYDPNPEKYTPAVYVGDMFTLLDELSIERTLLIGTSMGGLMAMIMANMQPSRFPAIVLNDIGPELDPVGLDRIKAYVGKRRDIRNWDDAVAATRDVNGPAFPKYSDEEWLGFTRCLYHEENGVPVPSHDAAIAKPMLEDDSNSVPPDLWPLFEGMKDIPMLLVRGELTDLLTMDCVKKMQAISPGMAVAQIPDRGHAPMLDEPAAVEAIDTLLAHVDGG